MWRKRRWVGALRSGRDRKENGRFALFCVLPYPIFVNTLILVTSTDFVRGEGKEREKEGSLEGFCKLRCCRFKWMFICVGSELLLLTKSTFDCTLSTQQVRVRGPGQQLLQSVRRA